MGIDKTSIDVESLGDIHTCKGMVRASFNFWVGLPMDKFYDGLKEGKLIGNKCPKCGKVFLPPRKTCGDCFVRVDEYVDMPETAVLKNFTVTNYKVAERKSRKVKKDIMVGLVQVDGSDTAMMLQIMNTTPAELKTGMKLKIVWNKRLKGHPDDIRGFEPA